MLALLLRATVCFSRGLEGCIIYDIFGIESDSVLC